jgi:hypothetical protein
MLRWVRPRILNVEAQGLTVALLKYYVDLVLDSISYWSSWLKTRSRDNDSPWHSQLMIQLLRNGVTGGHSPWLNQLMMQWLRTDVSDEHSTWLNQLMIQWLRTGVSDGHSPGPIWLAPTVALFPEGWTKLYILCFIKDWNLFKYMVLEHT